MPTFASRKVVGKVTQPQYADLKALTDDRALDSALLEELVEGAVRDRLNLARGFLEAARLLAASPVELVRRSAISRAYYAAYHATRAAVFAIRHRDEDDHAKLPGLADDVLRPLGVGERLKDLRRSRNEVDYSPYPGPDERTQYDPDELHDVILGSIDTAEKLLRQVENTLELR